MKRWEVEPLYYCQAQTGVDVDAIYIPNLIKVYMLRYVDGAFIYLPFNVDKTGSGGLTVRAGFKAIGKRLLEARVLEHIKKCSIIGTQYKEYPADHTQCHFSDCKRVVAAMAEYHAQAS